jgi:hypothetical protein
MSILELFGWKQPTDETAEPTAEAPKPLTEQEQFQIWMERVAAKLKQAAEQNQPKDKQ